MINRQNWMDARAYLTHLTRLGRDPQTIRKYWNYLRHLIEWADETPLPKAHKIDPVLPVYLSTARNDGSSASLSYTTIYKSLTVSRQFFEYARAAWGSRYHLVSSLWLSSLVPHSKPEPSLDDHRFYTLDEVRAIARVATETLHEERAQAGACMLFLSGMRPDAMASAPIQCIDLPNRRIQQKPSMGIRTKNDKAAITYLLDIPDLLSVVEAWDKKVRHMAPTSLWYAPLQNDRMSLKETSRAIEGRVSQVGVDIRLICDRAGVEYKSPHKFRHGHIVYARSLARTIDEVKAISQNVMHANIIITDEVYSALQASKVQSTIFGLGSQNKKLDQAELLRLIELLKDQLI